MITVSVSWHNSEEQCLVVELEADTDRPDLLTDLTNRCASLLRESLGAVFGIEADTPPTP